MTSKRAGRRFHLIPPIAHLSLSVDEEKGGNIRGEDSFCRKMVCFTVCNKAKAKLKLVGKYSFSFSIPGRHFRRPTGAGEVQQSTLPLNLQAPYCNKPLLPLCCNVVAWVTVGNAVVFSESELYWWWLTGALNVV